MIPVTKPFLPPREAYEALITKVFDRNWLTNNGPLVNELELQLKRLLGQEHLLYLTNGTVALQLAIRALDLQGEVITTPFSYVATTSALVWEGCTPVFADIEDDSLNLDPKRIEEAITPKTTGILATHVYGNPCNVEAIKEIAEAHKLKVIYDAAHAFGTTYKGRSLFSYGDISTTSFHATKLFHTVEGGAVFTASAELTHRMAKLRNFGHDGEFEFDGVGINAKNSEFHAAMGLTNLPHVPEILAQRKALVATYRKALAPLDVSFPSIRANTEWNAAYFPVLFSNEKQLEAARAALQRQEIFTRRYFYPLLSELDYVEKRHSLPVAEDTAPRVLCLPLYHQLTPEEVQLIARILLRHQNYA